MFVPQNIIPFSMFRWFFQNSNDLVEVPTEKVNEIMEDAHIVKDFYNR